MIMRARKRRPRPGRGEAAAPVASADRSMVRGLMVTPARPASRAAARAKETSAPARAVISERPGDSEPSPMPSCWSRGANPCLHSRQWYQARFSRTGPSAVVTVLSRTPA